MTAMSTEDDSRVPVTTLLAPGEVEELKRRADSELRSLSAEVRLCVQRELDRAEALKPRPTLISQPLAVGEVQS